MMILDRLAEISLLYKINITELKFFSLLYRFGSKLLDRILCKCLIIPPSASQYMCVFLKDGGLGCSGSLENFPEQSKIRRGSSPRHLISRLCPIRKLPIVYVRRPGNC